MSFVSTYNGYSIDFTAKEIAVLSDLTNTVAIEDLVFSNAFNTRTKNIPESVIKGFLAELTPFYDDAWFLSTKGKLTVPAFVFYSAIKLYNNSIIADPIMLASYQTELQG